MPECVLRDASLVKPILCSQESGGDSRGGGADGLFGWSALSGLFRCLNQRSHTNQNTRETKETRQTRETKYTR